MTELRDAERSDGDGQASVPKSHFVHQKNVQSTVGPGPRQFLEMTRAPNFPLKVIRLGKLRLVERDLFIDYLRSLGEVPAETKDNDVDKADPADQVLHEVLGKGTLRAV